MSIKKKIERIIYKINPSKNNWKIEKEKTSNFYSVGYLINEKEIILCFAENENDVLMLYEYLVWQLVAFKIIRVICELKKKN